MAMVKDYEVDLLRFEDDLDKLRTDWEHLYKLTNTRNPFLSYDWSRAWRTHLCPPSELFLLTARYERTLVGLLPLRLERKGVFRVLRFLVDGRADYLGLLLASGHDEAARALLEGLVEHGAAWDVAVLRNWNDALLELNSLPIPDRLGSVQAETRIAPHLSFPGSWEQLYKSGPSQLQGSRRNVRKFERVGGTVEHVVGDRMVQTIAEIAQVEANSWKAGTRAARFCTEHDLGMLQALLESTGLHDDIEVWMARIDGAPIAFLFNFTTPERTCYYQGAYDQNFQGYSPGSILHYYAIERTWRQDRREYDFMMGDEAWKTRWTNEVRTLRQLALFRKTLRGFVAFMILVAPKMYIRRWIRTVGAVWLSISVRRQTKLGR